MAARAASHVINGLSRANLGRSDRGRAPAHPRAAVLAKPELAREASREPG